MTTEFLRADPAEYGPAFLALCDEMQDDGEHARRVMATVPHELFIGRDDGKVIGGVLCSHLRVDGHSRGSVENLVVSASHHGRGIGRRLMEMAEEHYRAAGVKGMQLTIRADNAPARALYDSLGYSPVERRVRMWKQFAPAAGGDGAREGLRVVQRWTDEVWNEGRLDLVPELVGEWCLRHDPGKPPTRISLAQNMERIAAFRQQVPDVHFTNDDVVIEGDRVVARFTMTGTDPEKGERFVFSAIEIFRLDNGKIVETWSSETAQGPWQESVGR